MAQNNAKKLEKYQQDLQIQQKEFKKRENEQYWQNSVKLQRKEIELQELKSLFEQQQHEEPVLASVLSQTDNHKTVDQETQYTETSTADQSKPSQVDPTVKKMLQVQIEEITNLKLENLQLQNDFNQQMN